MNAALPFSAQAQKGSSSGSEDMDEVLRTEISVPSSRSRLMKSPIVADRTLQRFKISLYSARISSVYSHRKCPSSIHFKSKMPLSVSGRNGAPRNAAAPAITTDVSTTPLGSSFCLRDKFDLRLFLSLTPISSYLLQNVLVGNRADLIASLL